VDEQSEHGGDVFAERRAKLAAWRDAGDVYPTKYQPRDEIGPLHDDYAGLEAGQDSGDVHRIAGRVMARRVHGKLTFVVLKDSSGELQLFAQLDALGAESYAAMEHVDLGDFVGSAEADPVAHKLSNESPVGNAIMGHKPGDKVTVSVPQGSKKFKVLAIEKA
jgi:lysyl-tRNA synthetase class II